MNWLLRTLCERIYKSGTLKLTDPQGQVHVFGNGAPPTIHIAIRTQKAVRAIAFNPTLAVPEAFMDGEFQVIEGDLLGFLQLTYANVDDVGGESAIPKLIETGSFALRRLQQINTTSRSRQNVHHHYDLSGELYRLFLDEDMQYSCAYFESPDVSLEEAQRAKKRNIVAKLKLEPGQKVLDIGSGWGGLGLFLGGQDVHVDGVTLSTEQLAVSQERARQAGLSDRVSFELKDYRHVQGPYDRIVSVGMFEHVGVNHYRTYFDKCAGLLKKDGVMLLHTIGRSGPPSVTNGFIRKYIFPGGYIPALSEMLPAIERAGLVVTDVEVLRMHYAETLKAWRERFMANRQRAVELYDERFARMWEFYLAGSEAAFRWQDMVVFQIQIARRNDTLPFTRDYIGEERNRLASAQRPRRRGYKEAAE
jgi:cyclopropane-fatty-acyl-phospholipid synthase